MTVMEAVDMLDDLVDESDPDVDFPNSFHAFQTAEGIRKAHPDKGTLHSWGGRCAIIALKGDQRGLILTHWPHLERSRSLRSSNSAQSLLCPSLSLQLLGRMSLFHRLVPPGRTSA